MGLNLTPLGERAVSLITSSLLPAADSDDYKDKKIKRFQGIVQHFGKYVHLLSCLELGEKTKPYS